MVDGAAWGDHVDEWRHHRSTNAATGHEHGLPELGKLKSDRSSASRSTGLVLVFDTVLQGASWRGMPSWKRRGNSSGHSGRFGSWL